jgi:hypothetical protein
MPVAAGNRLGNSRHCECWPILWNRKRSQRRLTKNAWPTRRWSTVAVNGSQRFERSLLGQRMGEIGQQLPLATLN